MIRVVFLILLFYLQACGNKARHTVNAILNNKINIDGERIEPEWAEADIISNFTNPWNPEVSPTVRLSLLKDEKNLYFFFQVTDDEILEVENFTTERDVEKEDRVELFFSKDKDMKAYYCFEMDASGRTLSYAAQFYRQMNFEWAPPEGYKVMGQKISGGYHVEGVIPLSFLDSLTTGNKIFFGAYCAAFRRQGNTIEENWLTWINPKTPTPDFHVPASLGILYLSNELKQQ